MIFDFMSPNCLSQTNMADISGKNGMYVVKADVNSQGINKFSEKLSKLLDNREVTGKSEIAATCNKTCSQEPESDFDKLMSSLAEEIKTAKGNNFINSLKTYLFLSGNKSEGISLNDQSLKDFEKLLIKAGFDKSEIDDLIKQLKLKSKDGKVNLADLFKGLSTLKSLPKLKNVHIKYGKKDKNDDPGLLAISALPFIESIMSSLGIPEDLSGKIIADAKKEGRGINLDILIDGLQQLSGKSFMSGMDFKVDPDDKNFAGILEQMGFPIKQSDTAEDMTEKNQFALKDFLAGLEQMRKNHGDKDKLNSEFDTGQNISENEDDLLNTFMAGLAKGNNGGKNFKVNRDKAKENALVFLKSQGFLKESFFPLQTGLKLNENQFTSNGTDNDPELAKLLDNVADLLNADPIDHHSPDVSKKNQGILFDKTDKTSFIKVLDPENASGGAFREAGTAGKNFISAGSVLSRKTLPSYVTNQVVRSLVRSVYRGDNELRLQLKPPELGRLVMKIDNLGDSLKVSIVTENHVARDIIASHENSLKAALAGSGISIETFDVSMGSNFSQSMADTGSNAGAGSGSGNKRRSGSTMDISDEIMNNKINKDTFFNDGVLHFVA